MDGVREAAAPAAAAAAVIEPPSPPGATARAQRTVSNADRNGAELTTVTVLWELDGERGGGRGQNRHGRVSGRWPLHFTKITYDSAGFKTK